MGIGDILGTALYGPRNWEKHKAWRADEKTKKGFVQNLELRGGLDAMMPEITQATQPAMVSPPRQVGTEGPLGSFDLKMPGMNIPERQVDITRQVPFRESREFQKGLPGYLDAEDKLADYITRGTGTPKVSRHFERGFGETQVFEDGKLRGSVPIAEKPGAGTSPNITGNIVQDQSSPSGYSYVDQQGQIIAQGAPPPKSTQGKDPNITGNRVQDPNSRTGWSYVDQQGQVMATGAPAPGAGSGKRTTPTQGQALKRQTSLAQAVKKLETGQGIDPVMALAFKDVPGFQEAFLSGNIEMQLEAIEREWAYLDTIIPERFRRPADAPKFTDKPAEKKTQTKPEGYQSGDYRKF